MPSAKMNVAKVLNFFEGFPSSGIFFLKYVVGLHRAPVAGAGCGHITRNAYTFTITVQKEREPFD